MMYLANANVVAFLLAASLLVGSNLVAAGALSCGCDPSNLTTSCLECTDDGYPFPTLRYTAWDLLPVDDDDETKEIAEGKLNYQSNGTDWDELGVAAVEELSWESMSGKKNAAKKLGFDEGNWDCWMNHYSDYDWDELVNEEVDGFWLTLGWNETGWYNDIVPESDAKEWFELSQDEKEAAFELCFFQYSWNDKYLFDWDMGAIVTDDSAS